MTVRCQAPRSAPTASASSPRLDDKTARVWEVFPDTQALVSAAKAAVPRCLTLAQRKAFYLSPDPPAWCVEKAKWPFNTAEWEQWLRDLQDGENPPLPAAP